MTSGFTRYVPHEDVWRAIRSCASRLQRIAGTFDGSTDANLQTIASNTTDPVELVVGRIMLDAAQRAERRCPYSAGEALRRLLFHLRKISRLSRNEQLALVETIRSDHLAASDRALAHAMVPTSEEMNSVIERFVEDPVARCIVGEIVSQGGLDGKYTLDVGRRTVTVPVIESTLGYNFSVMSSLPVEGKDWVRSDVRVLVIDGVVEFVHELHHAFERASGRFPLVIAARRFGDEVLHTIRVNQSRGTLDVLLVSVPMELDSLNTLKDLSITCSTEVVSALKGQSVASVDVESILAVKEITYRPGLLTVVNPRAGTVVEKHRASLLELRDRAEAGVARFYEQRLKSLSPNHTLVKLPQTYDLLSSESLADRVACGLRLIRAVHEAGVCFDGPEIDITLRRVVADRFATAQATVLASIDSLLIVE